MVQQEVTTKHGWSRKILLCPSSYIPGWEPLTMNYRQTATNEQTTLFVAEKATKPKVSVPIYRVTLVREGRVPCYEQRIRSSATAYPVLQEFLADTDREM